MATLRRTAPRRRRARPRSPVRSAIAGGTWGRPRDGVTHGMLEIDVTEAERWCAAQAGVGLVHVVGSALARALREAPDANARVVLGAARRRPRIDIAYVVDVGGGTDMGAVCLRDADRLGPRQAARGLLSGARALRRGRDGALGRARAAAGRVPGPVLRLGMRVAGGVAGGLGRRVPGIGVPAHPFGSALVSSLEAWGVERALPPLVPFARLGLVVTVGAAAWRPAVHGGEVVPRRLVELGITFDHRLADGAQMGALMAAVREGVARPWEAWPADGGRPPPAASG